MHSVSAATECCDFFEQQTLKMRYLTKIFCLMAMVLCVNAFAAEAPAEGIVLRVSGETGGEIVFYDD